MIVGRASIVLLIPFLVTGKSDAQTHFIFTSNTGNNATVGIPTSASPGINGVPLSAGDEIGAFTPEGLCVGATVWNGANTSITVWGDNDQTTQVDGIKSGEQIVYRIWSKATEKEYDDVGVAYSEGDGIYGPDKIFVIDSLEASSVTSVLRRESTALSFDLSQNSPNPFNPTTVIRYELPRAGFVVLEVYDLLGKKVGCPIEGYQSAGNHAVDFNASSLPSGIYFYRLAMQSLSLVRKMAVIK